MRPMTKKELLKAICDCPDDDSPVLWQNGWAGDAIGYIVECHVSKETGKNVIWLTSETLADRRKIFG